jgi:glutamine amidotransferase PdxT
VNLATYLLLDAFDQDCEAEIIISNDSDLAEPIYQVRKRFGIKTVTLHPLRAPVSGRKPQPNYKLVKAASKSVQIKEASLIASQFPPTLTDAHGTITKPVDW